jgi:hypothetical protein
MCRNIKTLRQAATVASHDEIRLAALQYVRKVSGFRAPSRANQEVFEAAVEEVARATQRLLESLRIAGQPTTPAIAPTREAV